MKKSLLYCLPYFCLLLLILASCDSMVRSENKRPIILGDSSTIVTEPNTKNLQDIVSDLRPDTAHTAPATAPSANKAVTKPATDTQKHSVADDRSNTLPAPGLNAPFKEILFSIPGINVKAYKTQDFSKTNSATFQLMPGTLNGKQIKIANGTANTISQRYQTIIVLKNDLGTLPLETLNYVADWDELDGKNNVYTISSLSGKLESAAYNMRAMQKAIKNAARKHHLSNKATNEWENSVRNTRKNKHAINVVLRYVVWKIEGKDANGKKYSKQVRVDLPPPAFEKN